MQYLFKSVYSLENGWGLLVDNMFWLITEVPSEGNGVDLIFEKQLCEKQTLWKTVNLRPNFFNFLPRDPKLRAEHSNTLYISGFSFPPSYSFFPFMKKSQSAHHNFTWEVSNHGLNGKEWHTATKCIYYSKIFLSNQTSFTLLLG